MLISVNCIAPYHCRCTDFTLEYGGLSSNRNSDTESLLHWEKSSLLEQYSLPPKTKIVSTLSCLLTILFYILSFSLNFIHNFNSIPFHIHFLILSEWSQPKSYNYFMSRHLLFLRTWCIRIISIRRGEMRIPTGEEALPPGNEWILKTFYLNKL